MSVVRLKGEDGVFFFRYQIDQKNSSGKSVFPNNIRFFSRLILCKNFILFS